jgi:hypothetical protein
MQLALLDLLLAARLAAHRACTAVRHAGLGVLLVGQLASGSDSFFSTLADLSPRAGDNRSFYPEDANSTLR